MTEECGQVLEEMYKQLLTQYNTNKEQIRANQLTYNSKLIRNNQLTICIAQTQATLQLLEMEEEDYQNINTQLTIQQMENKNSALLAELEKEQSKFKQIEQKSIMEMINKQKSLQEHTKKLQELRIKEKQEWNTEKQKSLVENINMQISLIQEKIQNKYILKEEINDPITLQKIHNEYEDYLIAENKLRTDMEYRQEEEKIQRNKVVIQYNKLQQLKFKKQQLQQELKALKHHSEEIGTRISAMRKEQKKVNENIRKNKNKKIIGGLFPVREEIAITEKENQILEMELGKEEKKLVQLKKINQSSSPASQLQTLKQEHQELKVRSDLLHKQTVKNKKQRQMIKKLTQSLQNTKGIQDRHIHEKKNQLVNYNKKIKQLQVQKTQYQLITSQSSNLLFEYMQHSKQQPQQAEIQTQKQAYKVQENQHTQKQEINNNNSNVVRTSDSKSNHTQTENSKFITQRYYQLTIILIVSVLAILIVFK